MIVEPPPRRACLCVPTGEPGGQRTLVAFAFLHHRRIRSCAKYSVMFWRSSLSVASCHFELRRGLATNQDRKEH